MPRQGWLYISSNHLCFYAFIMGKETRLVLPWTDVVELDTKTKMLLADGISVRTRNNEVYSSAPSAHVPSIRARALHPCASPLNPDSTNSFSSSTARRRLP